MISVISSAVRLANAVRKGQVPEDSEWAEVRKKLLIQQPVEQTSSGRIADLLYLTRSARIPSDNNFPLVSSKVPILCGNPNGP
jgi:hypothetical protein